MIKIHDSMSGTKKPLRWRRSRQLKFFVCGPTVYNYIHIGNARTYIAFDTIVRYLRYLGYDVYYLQNITDMDDKIIAKAKEEKVSPIALAHKYEEAYHAEEKLTNITSVTRYARATDYIAEIVKQIKTLVRKGHAYQLDDGYYFDIRSFSDYGKLSKRTALQAEDAVSRVDDNPRKRNKGDFAVWKFSKPGEPVWKTEIGEGRPGWHIEDTAITEKHFGPRYNLHGGGIDLKFPHHEAEIAIQESVSGKKPLVKIWMHTGLISLDGGKMSKSLGNIVTVKEFLKKYSGNTLRFLTIQSHYRSRCEFGGSTAQNAEGALQSLNNFLRKLELVMSMSRDQRAANVKLLGKIKKARAAFRNAMDDDFNTPRALGALFGFINGLNKILWNFSRTQARLVKDFIEEKFGILGIVVPRIEIPDEVAALVKRRELFRSNEQFDQADGLRKKIEELGYITEDTPLGPLTLKK